MNKSSLSARERGNMMAKLAGQKYDLLVIGGGITGAGIALDAASRGLSIALVDKQDFAAGTSSRSTKLIHGGLRYLKQLELSLVREVGRERSIIHRNATHLVHPFPLLVPVLKGGTYSRPALRIGLWLYDLLAAVTKLEKHRVLSAGETLVQEPLLNKNLVKGSGIYTEYMTDDARLTIEVLKTAASYGADCINYGEAVGFIYDENKKVTGAKMRDAVTGQTFAIHAEQVINAAGPWVDDVRVKDSALKGKTLHHTKGIHLVVPYERLPLKQPVYFDAFDKRLVFAIPRGKITYIGTTDTEYRGSLEQPDITAEDITYLLKAVNHVFPSVRIEKKDILSGWAGIRPLIHEEGKSPSEISRKDEIFISDSGLISIAGGKLTGYRQMAEKVVDLAMEKSERSFMPSRTGNYQLTGNELQHPDQLSMFNKKIHALENEFGKEDIESLKGKYGYNALPILESALAYPNDTMRLLKAELHYCIDNEGVIFPGDFLTRRTGRLLFEPQSIEELFPVVLNELTAVFSWDEATRKRAAELFEAEMKGAMVY